MKYPISVFQENNAYLNWIVRDELWHSDITAETSNSNAYWVIFIAFCRLLIFFLLSKLTI